MHIPCFCGDEDVELPRRMVSLTERAWHHRTPNRNSANTCQASLPTFRFWGFVFCDGDFSCMVDISNCLRGPAPKPTQEKMECNDTVLLRRSSNFAEFVFLDRLRSEGAQ